jgi:hypothetical protein
MAGALCGSSGGELSCSVWLVGFDDLCEGGVELGASNEATLVK